MPREWALGACCALASFVLSATGQTLQRLSHVQAERACDKRGPWCRPLWYVGVIVYVLASPADLAAFYYAPLGLVSVVYGLRLPLIAVLAWALLEAQISVRCASGIFYCVAGSLISLACAPHASNDAIEAPADFFTPVLRGYLAFTGCAWVLLMLAWRSPARASWRGVEVLGPGGLAVPLLTAWIFQVEKLFNSAMGLVGPSHSFATIRWAWMPACVATFGLLELYLNLAGLVHQSTHVFLPMVSAFGSLITGFQSVVVLGEFSGKGMFDFALWAAGMGVSLLGAALVGLSVQVDTAKDADYKRMSSSKV